METTAIVIEGPHRLGLQRLALESTGGADEIVVEVSWSGISTGTERLLWSGRMPPFPGLGYPLVPGYEAVGRVIAAGDAAAALRGRAVYVPGANCYGPVRGLFGGSARRLVTRADKVVPLADDADERATLLALTATAWHALGGADCQLPDLIVGHGVLGRLLARLTLARGGEPPVVWERSAARRGGAHGYTVVDPDTDARRDYRCIVDASGAPDLLDTLVQHLAPRGEIVLAGFYAERVGFAFPPAFMKEIRLRVAAEWQRADLDTVNAMVAAGSVSLDDLITHRAPATAAADAYPTAFEDHSCLKMVLDWRNVA
ncbi:MAG: chlorophyll synthesis pathway protein BchC [Gammaproteobacteria bacterium]